MDTIDEMYRASHAAIYARREPVKFLIGQHEWRTIRRHAAFKDAAPAGLKVWGIPTEVTDDPAGFGIVTR